ncbi:hypothetical protein [Dyadobacter sp. Leaf189]|uniref:hypothetical protein n=1 Tax=Dyadobacter sp. Leaf189 TaxID=1736295 RepID=UPI00138F6951|nr:hypothetical protein [Dyadobacter sp. Leaf189]
MNSLVEDRVQPNIIKAGTHYPAVYVFTDRMTKLGCYGPGETRMGIVEIGVFAESYGQAYNLMKAIREALDDFSGIVNNVGITIMRGEEVADQFDEKSETHIKVIEYEAIAEPK